MTTRALITLKDETSELHFYRHGDAYPDAVMPILGEFLNLISTGHVRNNTMQAAGWLIQLGREELEQMRSCKIGEETYAWKYSMFEPIAEKEFEFIDVLYEVDLVDKTVRVVNNTMGALHIPVPNPICYAA